MKPISTTSVFSVNGRLVVADSIEEAVEIYKSYYECASVRIVEQVRGDRVSCNDSDYTALIKK
jgi:hypothetical protein